MSYTMDLDVIGVWHFTGGQHTTALAGRHADSAVQNPGGFFYCPECSEPGRLYAVCGPKVKGDNQCFTKHTAYGLET